MGNREQRTDAIIKTTIAVLAQDGAGGLSMRGIADETGISLGNLQYYYKDRDALLIATTQYYFKQCEQEVAALLGKIIKSKPVPAEKIIRQLLGRVLMEEANEHCAMFREIWALAVRNKALEQAVHEYYRNYCNWLAGALSSLSSRPERIVGLLVPYVEGYSIMGKSLSMKKNGVIDMLVELLLL